jgi:hypothetical protein
MRAHEIFAAYVIGVAACSGAAPPPPVSSVALVLGAPTAAGGFAPLAAGQDVTLVEGAQGGFHVWMKYRARGMSAQPTELERTAHRASDGVVVLRTMSVADVGAPDADGWFESPDALPMFMCPTPIGISIVDQPITFELRFVDAGQTVVEQSIELVPRCPDAGRDLCQRICTG